MKRTFILITLFLFSCETKNKSFREMNEDLQIAKPKVEKLKVTDNSINDNNQKPSSAGIFKKG